MLSNRKKKVNILSGKIKKTLRKKNNYLKIIKSMSLNNNNNNNSEEIRG
jgi:hypothetical protein